MIDLLDFGTSQYGRLLDVCQATNYHIDKMDSLDRVSRS